MEWVGLPFVVGSSYTVKYALVTFALFGVQFIWSLEQAYVNVYLLDLGLTKSSLSLVWLTGPVCGLIVQPIAGILSDYSTSSHGRRRPFMIWGSLATCVGLLVFAYARELGKILHIRATIVGLISIIVVNVAINTCQTGCRALIVDMFGAERQTDANGWASRMCAIGHLVSYGMGALDLTVLGFQNQMKAASVLYSIILVISVAISSCSVKERILIEPLPSDNESRSGWSPKKSDRIIFVFKSIWENTLNLDEQLKNIFKVQLFAWYAWFTFLFYGSTYAAEIWQSQLKDVVAKVADSHSDDDTADLARIGSLALLAFSISTTIFSLVLPKFKLNLSRVWFWSLVIYAVGATATAWATTFKLVLVIFVIIGYSWAVTLWIPFALTAQRIHQLPNSSDLHEHEFQAQGTQEDGNTIEIDESVNGLPDSHDEKSGIILGIHNSAIALPQFISAFGSYVIFRLMDTDPSNPHEDGGKAIATALQAGAFAALLGAFYAFKLSVKKE